jgi:hypothetical protein
METGVEESLEKQTDKLFSKYGRMFRESDILDMMHFIIFDDWTEFERLELNYDIGIKVASPNEVELPIKGIDGQLDLVIYNYTEKCLDKLDHLSPGIRLREKALNSLEEKSKKMFEKINYEGPLIFASDMQTRLQLVYEVPVQITLKLKCREDKPIIYGSFDEIPVTLRVFKDPQELFERDKFTLEQLMKRDKETFDNMKSFDSYLSALNKEVAKKYNSSIGITRSNGFVCGAWGKKEWFDPKFRHFLLTPHLDRAEATVSPKSRAVAIIAYNTEKYVKTHPEYFNMKC